MPSMVLRKSARNKKRSPLRETMAANNQSLVNPDNSILEKLTPRRTARRISKPVLDYQDIVNSARKAELRSVGDNDVHKLTPAIVGRCSSKRKRRRTIKKKLIINADFDEVAENHNDNEVVEHVTVSETVPIEIGKQNSPVATEDNSETYNVEENIMVVGESDVNVNVCKESENKENTLIPEKGLSNLLNIDPELGVEPLSDHLDTDDESDRLSLSISDAEDDKQVQANATFEAESSLKTSQLESEPLPLVAVQPSLVSITLTNPEQEDVVLHGCPEVVKTPNFNRSNTFDLTTLSTVKAVRKPAEKAENQTYDDINETNVTVRKCSKLFEEHSSKKYHNPKNTDSNKTISSATKKFTRTKLPNFSQIHANHFNRCENLVQHIERKNERAKLLINSGVKLRLGESAKKLNASNIASASKPKALKKIDLAKVEDEKLANVGERVNDELLRSQLSGPRVMPAKLMPPRKPTASRLRQPMKPLNNNNKQNTMKRMAGTILKAAEKSGIPVANVIKPVDERKAVVGKPATNEEKFNFVVKSGELLKYKKTAPASSSATGIKPNTTGPLKALAFNNVKLEGISINPCVSKSIFKFGGLKPATTTTTQTTTTTKRISDIRKQKHVQMLKQPNGLKQKVEESRNNAKTLIRGVRTNRRFELHMEYRKNL